MATFMELGSIVNGHESVNMIYAIFGIDFCSRNLHSYGYINPFAPRVAETSMILKVLL